MQKRNYLVKEKLKAGDNPLLINKRKLRNVYQKQKLALLDTNIGKVLINVLINVSNILFNIYGVNLHDKSKFEKKHTRKLLTLLLRSGYF